MKNFKIKLLVILINFLYQIITKPLSPKVLDLLDKDQLAFENFRGKYRYLSCKLIIYSKLKYMFETEIIDQFMNQTPKKKEFIDTLYDEMLKKCNNKMTDNSVFFLNSFINY